jgi:RHS repeat-associated protein
MLIDDDSNATTEGNLAFAHQDAFGVQITPLIATGLYGWRGQEGSRGGFDAGFVEMQARVYEPSIGRFLQEDSLPLASLTTQGMNRYICTENDPINLSDPTGLLGEAVFATLSIIIGAGLVATGIALIAGNPLLGLGTAFAGLALILDGIASLVDDPVLACKLRFIASVFYLLGGLFLALSGLGALVNGTGLATSAGALRQLLTGLGAYARGASVWLNSPYNGLGLDD